MKKIFIFLIALIFISLLYSTNSNVEISEKTADSEETKEPEDDIVIEEDEEDNEQDEQIRQEKLQKQKLQEYQGECEDDAKLCLPFKQLSFAEKVWGSKTPDQYLADLNEFVQENFIFKKDVEFEIDQQRNLKAVLKEDVEEGDTLAAYFNQDEVYQSDSLGRIFFHSYDQVDAHLELVRKLKFTETNDINRDRLRLAVVLLYHFYHIEHSKYAADLRLFPRTINNPMITLTMYELDKFLKFDKMIYKSVIFKRKEVLEQYESVNNELKNQLLPEEIVSFLDGRESIPLDDFVYIISVIDSKGIATTHEKLKDQVFWFIQPVLNHLGFGENFVKTERQLKFHFTGKDLYSSRIFFNKEIKSGFQIKIDFLEHKSQVFFLNNAIIPRQNDLDCIHLKLMDPEIVEVFKLLDNLCLHQDHLYMEHYHNIAIILNMDDVEKDLCTQTIKKYNLKDPQENKKIFNRKCEFKGGFKKYDFWKEPLAIIKAQSVEFHKILESLDDYIKERSQNHKTIDNAILITEYLSNRQTVVNKIRNKIKEMITESLKKKEPTSDPRPDFKMKNQDQEVEHIEL